MSDDKRQAAEDSAAGPIAGERLAEARRLKQISLPDVARQLHLDERRVQALEENRFDVLGAPVFAKGYLRKYAKLVGASIDDIMADYYTLNRATGAPPVVGRPRKRHRDIDPVPWIAGLLLVLVLAGVSYWWMHRSPAAAPETPAASRVPVMPLREPAKRRAETEATEVTDGPVQEALPPASGATEPEATPAAGSVPAASRPVPASAANAELELSLTYSGDCWTEVSDASGRRLFFDLGTAGRTVTVHGAPPLRVLIGNDDNVRLTVDGRRYPIAATDRRGNTARFTINR